MSRLTTVLTLFGIVSGTVAGGLTLGWLATRQPTKSIYTNPTSKLPEARATEISTLLLDQAPVALAANAPGLVINWEEKLAMILTSNADDPEKGYELLKIFPNLPEEGQIEVAQQLSNLLPNDDFPSLAQYLTNPATPEPVLDVILAGLVNRSDSVKLPYLLEVAREDQNPKAGEAKDLLEALLDENYGNDWSQWQARVDQWVKDYSD
jgi:hypothetical protein